MSTLFETSVASIDDAYRHLGHTLGWRFLTGPRATLSADVDMAFITLNPGGEREDGPVTIARIPHLSRFRLFGNPIRAPQLNVVVAHLAAAIDPGCAA